MPSLSERAGGAAPAVARPATTTRPGPAWTRRLAGLLERPRALLLLYLGLSLLLLLPAWLPPGRVLIGPSGDAEQATWLLAWTPHALAHGWNPLLTDQIGHPAGANLMWTMLMPLCGVLLWPVTATAGPVVSYDLLVTVAPALAAWCAFLCLRRHVRRGGAAAAGGLVYGFGPYMAAHSLGHPNLTAAASIPPLVLLVVDDLLVRRRRRPAVDGVLLGLLAALGMVVFEEMLAVAAVGLAALLTVLALQHRHRVVEALPRVAVAGAVGAAVLLPLAAVPLAVQLLGPQHLTGHVQRPGFALGDLLNLVIPTAVTRGPDGGLSTRFAGNVFEQNLYLGVPLLAVAVVTAVRLRAVAAVRAAAVTGALLLLLSLGSNLHAGGADTGVPLPWRLLEGVPLLGDLLPTRLSLLTALAAALLLAVFVDRIVLDGGEERGTPGARARPAAGTSHRRRTGMAALGLVAVTLVWAVPLPTTTGESPAFFTGDAARIPEGSVALVLPWTQDWTSAQPMLWQTAAGFRYRMPDGYFIAPDADGSGRAGPAPTALGGALRDLAAGQTDAAVLEGRGRAAYAADLAAWGVGTVVLVPPTGGDQQAVFLTWLLRRAPVADQGALLWWDVHPAEAA